VEKENKREHSLPAKGKRWQKPVILPKATRVEARMAAGAPCPEALRVAYAMGAQRAPIVAIVARIEINGTDPGY
jgi:hypothetical protein